MFIFSSTLFVSPSPSSSSQCCSSSFFPCISPSETNDNLEDASNELILTDEDVVWFQIGEVFAHVPKDEVENRIENMKEVTSQKLTKLEGEKQFVVAQMAELIRKLTIQYSTDKYTRS